MFFLLLVFLIPLFGDVPLFHPDTEFVKNVPIYAVITPPVPCEDRSLVQRIMNAYQLADKEHLGNSMWQMFFDQKHREIDRVFLAGNLERATNILRYPDKNELFYGIDGLCSSFSWQYAHIHLVPTATTCLDRLVRFGEAIGAIRLYNPENDASRKWLAKDVIMAIETKLQCTIKFPNPYPKEVGVYTERGAASYRAIQALYQAILIKELCKDIPKPRILEIGAGLGRTAYYCKMFGIEDYTIIDIPMTALASSYFLGRTLGEDQVVLLGEALDRSENKIKILTPKQFFNDSSHYDLIVNVDSMTEMDPYIINAYLHKIQEICPLFLSINHEINHPRIFDMFSRARNVKKVQRKPYWMRLGYVEELYYLGH